MSGKPMVRYTAPKGKWNGYFISKGPTRKTKNRIAKIIAVKA
jgi:hypothetical protein